MRTEALAPFRSDAAGARDGIAYVFQCALKRWHLFDMDNAVVLTGNITVSMRTEALAPFR